MIRLGFRQSLGQGAPGSGSRPLPADGEGTGGFALALAVFTLVILGVIVASAHLVAVRQFRIASGRRQAGAALYAAEAGLSMALSGWGKARLDSVAAGSTVLLSAGQLSSGDEYAVYLSRFDAGREESDAYYLLASAGRAAGPRGGRRELGMMLRRPSLALCCEGALWTRGPLEVGDGARIDGRDEVPAAWLSRPEACGGAPVGDSPGVVTDDASTVRLVGTALVDGLPPLVESDAPAEHLGAYDGWRSQLSELADLEYEPGTTLTDVGPVTGEDGSCDTSAAQNWGAPQLPDHPCFDHLPVIHARGDLIIDVAAGGQGVLVVDGDLLIRGGFQFHGVVLVGGRLIVGDGGGRLYGAALIRNAALDTVRIGAGGVLSFASCAVRRAARSPKLQVPHPLAQFSWFEILE